VRQVIFRSLAGTLGLGLLATAWWMAAAAHAGEIAWQSVLPAMIGQLLFAPVFLLYALKIPGPFNRNRKP
jgi:tetrahydromethanopterin S-methyltransferase subunit C